MVPADAAGTEDDARAVLEELFQNAPVSPDWFAPLFLARVSLDQVASIVDDLERRYGGFLSIAADRGALVVHLAGADVSRQRSVSSTSMRLQPQIGSLAHCTWSRRFRGVICARSPDVDVSPPGLQACGEYL